MVDEKSGNRVEALPASFIQGLLLFPLLELSAFQEHPDEFTKLAQWQKGRQFLIGSRQVRDMTNSGKED
jgi:hypothetical protein